MSTDPKCVSLEAVLGSLRQQLGRSPTFVFEVLQNALRANAANIWVEWEESSGVMLFRDDGLAHENIAALFPRMGIGWGAELLVQKRLGSADCLATVLASQHIDIRTRHCRTELDSHDPVHLPPVRVRVHLDTSITGTELRLKLNPDPEPLPELHVEGFKRGDYWKMYFERTVRGFPIPVYFNGSALPRPHACDSGLEFVSTEVGQFYVKGLSACELPERREKPLMYCDGLPVRPPGHWSTHSEDVLHLDSQRFHARMPDRAVLISTDDGLQKIEAVRDELWRQRLIERHSQVPLQDFADAYWRGCLELQLQELLCAAPLTRSMLERYNGALNGVDNGDDQVRAWEGEAPGPEAILIERLDLPDESSASKGSARSLESSVLASLASIYSIERKIPILSKEVPPWHSARCRVVNLLDRELGLRYVLNGPLRRAAFSGERIECDVQLCESYTISFYPTASCKIPADQLALLTPVTVTDHAYYDAANDVIIVPAGAQRFGKVVGQVSTYEDDGEWRYLDYYERDQGSLERFVELLRAKTPHDYLEILLKQLSPDPELLGEHPLKVHYDLSEKKFVVSAL